MLDPETQTFEVRGGDPVTVVAQSDTFMRRTTYQGQPCVSVWTRGNHGAYFPADTRIIQQHMLSDGITMETLFVPGTPY